MLFVRQRNLTLLARVHHRVLLIRSHHDDSIEVEVVVLILRALPRLGADLALDLGQFFILDILLLLDQLRRLEPELLQNPPLLGGNSKG